MCHTEHGNVWNEILCVVQSFAFELSRTERKRVDFPRIPHSGEGLYFLDFRSNCLPITTSCLGLV